MIIRIKFTQHSKESMHCLHLRKSSESLSVELSSSISSMKFSKRIVTRFFRGIWFFVFFSFSLIQSPTFLIVPIRDDLVDIWSWKVISRFGRNLILRITLKLFKVGTVCWSVFTSFNWLKYCSGLAIKQGVHRQISLIRLEPYHFFLSLHNIKTLC